MRIKKSDRKVGLQPMKTRAKYQCPESLADLIQLVNFLPSNITLRSLKSITEEKNTRTYPLNFSDEQAKEAFYELYRELFKECFRYFSEDQKETILINYMLKLHSKKFPDIKLDK